MTTYIPTTEVAKAVRTMLRAEFGPAVKFSVRTTNGGASMRVSWTDGPTAQAVENTIGHMHCALLTLPDGSKGFAENQHLVVSRTVSDTALSLVWDEIAAHAPGWTVGGYAEQAHVRVDDAAGQFAGVNVANPVTGQPVKVPGRALDSVQSRAALAHTYARFMDFTLHAA